MTTPYAPLFPPPPARRGVRTAIGAGPVAIWHGAWALAAATGLALVLALNPTAPLRVLGALACAAAPGVVGWLDTSPRDHLRVLVSWAVGSGLAVALCGGLTGPAAPWCVAPLVAALALGGLWRAGAGLAFGVLAALAVVGAGGGLPPAPDGGLGLGVALIALISTLGAAGGALMMLDTPRAEPPLVAQRVADPDGRVAVAEAGRAQAEAARVKAETEARGKSDFLANMSHELRTPLNAIIGFSDIMRTRLFGELSPRYGEYAELIHESGQHLLDLINDVLDVSKIEADKYELRLETFDVREVADATLRLMRQQADAAGVRLRVVSPSDPLEVAADRRALKQIVLNLISNALKFTPPGGSVTVSFSAVGDALNIEVADTGVGIAPEDLVRLGRPYAQAGDAADRARGTGLGLSLVRAFARLHGGDLSIESRLGEGTAAAVRLPVLARPDLSLSNEGVI